MITAENNLGALEGRTVSPSELSSAERERMFELLQLYFDGVTREHFIEDLAEKDRVILIQDKPAGVIRGFSTQKMLNARVEEQAVRAIFSGDTIIEKEYWRQTVLVKEWFKLVFAQLALAYDTPLYWFLICMGYKTYRFLPVYFKSFYPSCLSQGSQKEKSILDRLAQDRFGGQYDPDTGIIRFQKDVVRLKGPFRKVASCKKRDKHIQYFLKTNRGYASGDELACLARLHPANFQPTVFRFTRGLERECLIKAKDLS